MLFSRIQEDSWKSHNPISRASKTPSILFRFNGTAYPHVLQGAYSSCSHPPNIGGLAWVIAAFSTQFRPVCSIEVESVRRSPQPQNSILARTVRVGASERNHF